jgi:protein ImuA
MNEAKKDIIDRLKQEILVTQGYKPAKTDAARITGLAEIEAAFPNGVLPTGMMHELICQQGEQAAVCGGFLTGLLASLMTPDCIALWISVGRRLFPPALKAFGIEPHQIVFIDVSREKEVLWAVEEALKCEGLTAVVAELRELNFTQSKRLQLAVEQSHVTGFILRNDPEKLTTTTCVSRWRVSSLASKPEQGLPGVGFPRWNVELMKVRNGQPGAWQVEWRGNRFNVLPPQTAAIQYTAPLKVRKAG